jgi:hypothetical protein
LKPIYKNQIAPPKIFGGAILVTASHHCPHDAFFGEDLKRPDVAVAQRTFQAGLLLRCVLIVTPIYAKGSFDLCQI